MRKNLKSKFLDILGYEPYKLGHWVGFKYLTELHNDWIQKMLYSTQDITILAHRGSYKTSCLSVAMAIHIVLFPNKNIIFVRKTDANVAEIINQTKNILQSDAMQTISGHIYGVPVKLTKSNANEITTDYMTNVKGGVQLLGLGIKGSITGKHADLIITDDIVTQEDRISKADRNYTKMVYMELQNIKNRGGRIVNTGTPWHKEDAISIMPNVEAYDCYTTKLISDDILSDIRTKLTPSLFAANYELKHIASETALITTPPKFFEDESLLYNGIVHIDASYGGNDASAMTICRRIGNKYYILGKRRQKHIDDCLDEFLLIKKSLRCGSILTESNADKGYLAKEIRRRGHYAREPYHENMNKYVKISSYLRPSWDNIYFHNSTDNDYVNEILDYTEDADHDDSPDSLASVLRTYKAANIIQVSNLNF